MASGVAINQECVDEFLDLKLKKKNTYIIFSLSDDKREIRVEKTSDDPSYEHFVNSLPETSCRYAVFDFAFDLGEGPRNKLCFITWSPDIARVKDKMVYAASKEALRRSLVGVGVEVQGTDLSEVSYESVLEKAARK